jgi:hypothetical protein
MRYLIDGHNLLHALGKLKGGISRRALIAAEKWLVALVQKAHGEKAQVVLDGHPPTGATIGPKVTYSGNLSADDVIEELIRKEPAPSHLTVVSDDRRLRHAAGRRGCASLRCLDYAEGFLLSPPSPVKGARPGEKGEKPTQARLEDWEAEFGGLDSEPGLEGPS